MKDLQLAVKNSKSELKKKPLNIFSCCPTSPLKWCEVTSQNLIDCARYSIPVEFIAMPLSGFMAPITLTGTLIQHTAETLSGVVIRQWWIQQGAMGLNARLHNEVNKLLKTYQPSTLPETTKKDLVKLMEKETRRHGQDHLPLLPMTT